MKLNKRACRHASNVPLHINLNAGVLYTEPATTLAGTATAVAEPLLTPELCSLAEAFGSIFGLAAEADI